MGGERKEVRGCGSGQQEVRGKKMDLCSQQAITSGSYDEALRLKAHARSDM